MQRKIKIFFLGYDYFGGQFLQQVLNNHSDKVEIVGIATNINPSPLKLKKSIKKIQVLHGKNKLLSELKEKKIFNTLINKKVLDNSPPVYNDVKVADLAKEYDIPVMDASVVYSGDVDTINSFGAQFIVVASFGKIPKEIYNSRPQSVISFHPSMLPQLKGGSSVYSALMKGFECTGFTYHLLAQKINSGPILYQEAIPISPYHTCRQLEKEIIRKGVASLPFVLTGLKKRFIVPIPTKDFTSSYCLRTYESSALLKPLQSTTEQFLKLVKACTSWVFGSAYIRKGYKHFYIISASGIYHQAHLSNANVSYHPGRGIVIKTLDGAVLVTKVYYKNKHYTGNSLALLEGLFF